MHNLNSFPELSGHEKRQLLRMFLTVVWGGDLMKLCDLFGEYDVASPEYRFLSGYMDIVEIDLAASGVRICRELRKKYPVFDANLPVVANG